MIRALLRNWLGITNLEARVVLQQGSVDGFAEMARKVLATQAEVNTMLQQIRELREMLADPKREPIKTRTWAQARALLEVE